MCSLVLIKVFMKCDAVLVLAGIELIFFIVASTVLWFGFVLKTMLITQ